jgi:hypothetical protein
MLQGYHTRHYMKTTSLGLPRGGGHDLSCQDTTLQLFQRHVKSRRLTQQEQSTPTNIGKLQVMLNLYEKLMRT